MNSLKHTTTTPSSTKALKPEALSFRRKAQDYALLAKVNLSTFVVFSALMTYVIVYPGTLTWVQVILLAIGGYLVTFASNTLNQVLEKDYDKLMKRTANRPLAAGRMSVAEAVLAAGIFCVVGVLALSSFNPMTGLLSMLSLVSYAFIYTPLKRVSPIAVAVGAIPGALPVLIGGVAALGYINELVLILFAIQFMWQFPHFWAIAWVGHEDYTNAGYRLLPNAGNTRDASVGLQSLIYTVLMLALLGWLYYGGHLSFYGTLALAVPAIYFCYTAWQLYRYSTREAALRQMFASFIYLPAVLIGVYIDQLIVAIVK